MARAGKNAAGNTAVDAQSDQKQAEKAAGGENTAEAGKAAGKGDNGTGKETLTNDAAGDTAVGTQDDQEQAEKAAGGENTAGAGKTAEKGSNGAGKETLVYIGPTVKGGALKTNAALTGTRGEIKEYLKGILEDIPQVEKLLVPVTRLADSKGKVKEKGTLLNKYYNEVASLDNAKRRG